MANITRTWTRESVLALRMSICLTKILIKGIPLEAGTALEQHHAQRRGKRHVGDNRPHECCIDEPLA